MQWSQAIGFDVQLKKYASLGGNMLLKDEFSLVLNTFFNVFILLLGRKTAISCEGCGLILCLENDFRITSITVWLIGLQKLGNLPGKIAF